MGYVVYMEGICILSSLYLEFLFCSSLQFVCCMVYDLVCTFTMRYESIQCKLINVRVRTSLYNDDDDDFRMTRKVRLEFGYVTHVVVKLNSYHESIVDSFLGFK